MRRLIAFLSLAVATAAWSKQPQRVAPSFVDLAKSSGLNFVHNYHPTPEKHLVESVPGGLAAFDYDADGWIDVFFTNGATLPKLEKSDPKYWNRLFRNKGNGSFEDVTERAGARGVGYSMGAAAADYDNDGHVDLFVAGVPHNQLLRNTGRGGFEDRTERSGIVSGEWSVAAGWFDFDNDRWLDLFVVNYVQWSPAFDRYCGDEARKIRVYCHPRYFQGLPNRLYRNKGDGTFEDVSAKSAVARHVGKGMSVAFGDYDGDTFLDVFVTNDGVPNFLFANRGDGTFEEVGLTVGVALPSHGRALSSMGTDFADYDNDGRADIHVTALNGETFPLFRNDGRGGFIEATHTTGLAALTTKRSGWCTAFVDADNDGWRDIFTANSHVNDRIDAFEASQWKQPNSLFANLANGRFADVSTAAGLDARSAAHRGCAAADFDGDGRLDIVVSALGEAAELWRNRTSPAGNWIVVDLRGTRSNRDGIGARVTVGNQAATMTTSRGYASSSRAGLHFGLGSQMSVPRIEIVWPSGARQVVENVKANQVVQVQEPAS